MMSPPNSVDISKSALAWLTWPPRSVSVNKCRGVGCASNAKRPRPVMLARCWMLMNAQS
jgi:hypothetical protein